MPNKLSYESPEFKGPQEEEPKWSSGKSSALTRRREEQRTRRAEGKRTAQAEFDFLKEPPNAHDSEAEDRIKSLQQQESERAARLTSPATFNSVSKTLTRPARKKQSTWAAAEPFGQIISQPIIGFANLRPSVLHKKSKPGDPPTGLYPVNEYYRLHGAKPKNNNKASQAARNLTPSPNKMAKHRRGNDEADEKNEGYASDGGFVEDAPKLKKAKSTISSKNASRSSNNDEQYWELASAKKRVAISDYSHNTFIDIREYYDKDGTLARTKKGLMLSIEDFSALLKAVPEIKKALAAKGVKLDESAAETEKAEEDKPAAKGKERQRKERAKAQKANIEATSDEDED